MTVVPGLIPLFDKFFLKLPKLTLEIEIKAGRRTFETFSSLSQLGSQKEILKGNNFFIEIPMASHARTCLIQPPN